MKKGTALRVFLAFLLVLPLAMGVQFFWLACCVAVWPLVSLLFFISRDRGFQKFFWGDFVIWPMQMFKSLVDKAVARVE